MNILNTIDTPIGSYAPDFELPGVDQQVHHLSRYLHKCQAVAVIFMSDNCPYVKCYLDRLKHLQREFATLGFTLIGVNGDKNVEATPMQNFDKMKSFALNHQLNFPYLWDSTQDVTQSFGARTTPTAFLIDKNGFLRYKGLIDDSPKDDKLVKISYLQDAVTSSLAGEEIAIQETKSIGTPLIWRN
ncbi:MAG: thioredoxin family protein [Calothrix sp. MO_167.B42]|nr:thioredoxin family protein [Calothrix sp. MO_167.B42]